MQYKEMWDSDLKKKKENATNIQGMLVAQSIQQQSRTPNTTIVSFLTLK
jgi:hypothetical protein